jgi:uncharacterized protein (DUF1501 family)
MTADPEYARLRSALSRPADTSPAGLSRRRFLQLAIASAGAVAAGPSLWSRPAAAAVQPGQGLLVLITLGGGNDGLDTVCPATNSAYRAARGTIALGAGSVLDVGGGLGLHPSLKKLKVRYDAGDVAVVTGIGYPEQELSHFESMAHWMKGSAGAPGSSSLQDGWVGRWLDRLPSGGDMAGVVLDASVPLHMIGRQRVATALPPIEGPQFGLGTKKHQVGLKEAVRRMSATSTGLGHFADLVGTTMARAIELTSVVAPVYGDGLPAAGFDRTMGVAARLFNANVGVRVISVELGGFDTHNGQPYNHQNLMTTLDTGIEEFFVQLAPELGERTAVATFSEFGRRLQRNASAGTDHGSASVAFVVGASVRGGVHGAYPSLTRLDTRGNLTSTVDFRSYYASLVDHWLGGISRDVLGGSFSPLGLFTTSGAAPGPSSPPKLLP